MISNTRKFKYFLLFSIFIPLCSEAQVQINSPYTRYGLGTIVDRGMEPRTMAMGGIHYGIARNDLINHVNPASYAAFDSVSFIFDAGMFGFFTDLRTSSVNHGGSFISLSHLAFGWPVTRWWKMSTGILPFSYVGYDIAYSQEEANIGTVQYNYLGSGGLNQLIWGNGFKLSKRLAVGINMKYIFGTISRIRGVSFPDSLELKNAVVETSFTPNDIFGEIGIQYRHPLSKEHYLVAGLTLGPEIKINTRYNYLSATYFGDFNSVLYSRDTIDSRTKIKGDFVMPVKLGAGISAGKTNEWFAGLDFNWQNWKDYRFNGTSDSLKNSWELNLGGEYIPDFRNTSSYWQRVSYRLGFNIGQSELYLKNKHLQEFGISFGLGLPIRKSKSTINAAIEIGKTGTTDNNLVQENFLQFSLGVNIFENWFIKRKYY